MTHTNPQQLVVQQVAQLVVQQVVQLEIQVVVQVVVPKKTHIIILGYQLCQNHYIFK